MLPIIAIRQEETHEIEHKTCFSASQLRVTVVRRQRVGPPRCLVTGPTARASSDPDCQVTCVSHVSGLFQTATEGALCDFFIQILK
jgi:hypothetical protein